ncbi:MAG TPA: DUF1287 domain-containing protein [Fimbriimonadaceae bacterium]|nr:DUF1287 domain-containing protein [Fimbriimonadaceae bacterium]
MMVRAFVVLLITFVSGCGLRAAPVASTPPVPARAALSGFAAKIVEGAKLQLVHPADYTGEYFSIPYPNGDVPADKGACVDVVIRALRHAGYDLQKLVHEDMERHLSVYPRHGDRTDPNIDHRRVPNLRCFFSRFGLSLSTRTDGEFAKGWRPGDIVSWKLDSGQDHIGVLSDRIDDRGLPFVIHNLAQTAEEDVLTDWKITGHYRFPGAKPSP